MRGARALLALCLVVAGCARSGVASGDALADDGAPGQVGLPHATAGEKDWFALPRFDNRTDEPVRIVGIRLVDRPAQVRVLRYRGQSAKAVGWVQLDYRTGGNPKENPLNTPEVPLGQIVVPPHARSDGYVMMLVELTQPKRAEMRHALVTYEVAHRIYEQQLSMDLVITPGTS